MQDQTDITPESRGLLLTITGNGKGKSTSAFGITIRALGWGWRVLFLQFVKGGRETGEKRFFDTLNDPHLVFDQLGAGATWEPGDHSALAQAGWKRAKAALADRQWDLVVLDELNIALHYGWLPLDDVLASLRSRKPELNVVVTGRYAPDALLEISDLISEIKAVRHPYVKGIPARPWIDF